MFKYSVGEKLIFIGGNREGRIFEVKELVLNHPIFGRTYMLKELYNRKEKDAKPYPSYFVNNNSVLYTKEAKILYGDKV